jgi:hypothetical protein
MSNLKGFDEPVVVPKAKAVLSPSSASLEDAPGTATSVGGASGSVLSTGARSGAGGGRAGAGAASVGGGSVGGGSAGAGSSTHTLPLSPLASTSTLESKGVGGARGVGVGAGAGAGAGSVDASLLSSLSATDLAKVLPAPGDMPTNRCVFCCGSRKSSSGVRMFVVAVWVVRCVWLVCGCTGV